MNHICKLTIAALALAACGIDLDEEDDELGSEAAEVLGGTLDTTHPEVCVMEITLPPGDDGQPQNPNPIRCTCTLVEAQTILTSASCVSDNVEADTIDDIVVKFGDSFSEGVEFGVTDVEFHRYFDPDIGGQFQLALIRLDAAPGETPAEINVDGVLQTTLPVTLIGFGEDMEGGTPGARRANETPITSVAEKFIFAGTDEVTTCAHDSGGPVYATVDGENEVVVAMTSRQGDCGQQIQRLRLDIHADTFILPYVDRFSGACPLDDVCTTDGCRSPDPDCPENACAWGNACEEDCPTRDWDCAIGTFVGEACAANGECEEGGRCIAATDDTTFLYCSRPCTMGAEGTCPAGMECTTGDNGDECTYLSPSPGSQGAACVGNADCRSDICENDICVFPCGPGGECAAPFTCGASTVADGAMVCLGEVIEGGGGFGLCAAGGDSRGWLSALGVLALAFAFRRPRKSSEGDLRG